MSVEVMIAALAAAAVAWLLAGGRPGGSALRRLGRPRDVDWVEASGDAVARARPAQPSRLGRGRDRPREERIVQELCTGLAGELRAGRPVHEALIRAAESAGAVALVVHAVAAARMGGDVAAALRADAAGPGMSALSRLAACWEVAQDSGAGLATAADRLAEGLRLAQAQREEVAAQLAGVRTSGRLLAGLPVLGLLLGAGLGARPMDVLLGTPYGIACLVAGLVLDGLGLVWVNRLAASAERAP